MDWLRDHMWETWLGLAMLLAVLEMFSMDFILLMLAAGALVGMGLAAFDAPIVVQVLGASGASLAMLALVRPNIVKRFHQGPDLQLGHTKLVGKQALVTERITGHETGRIKLAGETWSAKPYDETLIIEPGETVDVLEIRGATAYVHPLPRLES